MKKGMDVKILAKRAIAGIESRRAGNTPWLEQRPESYRAGRSTIHAQADRQGGQVPETDCAANQTNLDFIVIDVRPPRRTRTQLDREWERGNAMTYHFWADYPTETYVPHGYAEHTVDLGEVVMNYAVTGAQAAPALLLIPGQTESWWGYEPAMRLLEADFGILTRSICAARAGQAALLDGTRWTIWAMIWCGSSNWRSGVHALSPACLRGGVLSCWLSAYSPPGLIRGAYYEDAPLFDFEVAPACGHAIRQGGIGNIFPLFSRSLEISGLSATGKEWSPLPPPCSRNGWLPGRLCAERNRHKI